MTVELMPAGKQYQNTGYIISRDNRRQYENGHSLRLGCVKIAGIGETVNYYRQPHIQQIAAEGPLNKKVLPAT